MVEKIDVKFSHKNTQSKSSLGYLTKLRHIYGFTGLLNTHMMVIISTKDLTPNDKMVLLYIEQQTIGWNRLSVYFDTKTYSDMTGVSVKRVLTTLNKLEMYGIIERSKYHNHNKSKGVLRIEPEYNVWNLEYNRDLVESVIAENHRKVKSCDTQIANDEQTEQTVAELMKDF